MEQNREQVRCMKALLAKNLPPVELQEEVVELGYTDIADFHSELARVVKIIEKANKPKKPVRAPLVANVA